jgi:hypothetical protein
MQSALLICSFVFPALAMDIPRLAPNNAAAAGELKSALEAHMNGDDEEARRRLSACVKKAAPDSADLSGCRIYLEWWAKDAKQTDKPSRPEARRLYSIGADAYNRRDLELADMAWHECIEQSAVATAVRNDCLAMLDLIPKRPRAAGETKTRERYLAGFIAYGMGDVAAARAEWTACLASAPKNSPTWSDCRAGLARLDADKTKP